MDTEELEQENSVRPSSLSGVVTPSDMPMGGTSDVEDENASPGETCRQDVSLLLVEMRAHTAFDDPFTF